MSWLKSRFGSPSSEQELLDVRIPRHLPIFLCVSWMGCQGEIPKIPLGVSPSRQEFQLPGPFSAGPAEGAVDVGMVGDE